MIFVILFEYLIIGYLHKMQHRLLQRENSTVFSGV